MKQVIYLIAALLLPLCTFAQAPQAFSYQAIANNTNGTPVANGNVAVRISVLDNTATGTVLYTETHTKTTNAQGLFNLSIGQGAPTTGAFAAINWGANPKFVKVELDPAGGTNYTTVGTNQFQSVPYALYADKVNPANIATAINTAAANSNNSNVLIADYYDHKLYAHNSNTGLIATQPYSASYNGYPLIRDTCGNFIVGDYYDHKIYVYNAGNGAWSAQTYSTSYNGYPNLQQNCKLVMVADYYDHKIYACNLYTGLWTAQAYDTNYNGYPSITIEDGTISVGDYYAHKYYIYSTITGTWSSQPYSTNYNGYPNVIISKK